MIITFYAARDELFTKAEQKFLTVLNQAVGGERCIFAEVRLTDVINVRGLDPNPLLAFASSNWVTPSLIDLIVESAQYVLWRN